jgi:acetoin utilization protein AcuB
MTGQKRPSITLRSYMTAAPLTVGPEQTLARAHELMRSHRIRHLPVLHGGELVGIVSQRDLALIESLPDVDPAAVAVEDAMTTDVFTVPATRTLAGVVAEMADRKLGSAVVVAGGHVVGVFTSTDAYRALAQALAPKPRPASKRTRARR